MKDFASIGTLLLLLLTLFGLVWEQQAHVRTIEARERLAVELAASQRNAAALQRRVLDVEKELAVAQARKCPVCPTPKVERRVVVPTFERGRIFD